MQVWAVDLDCASGDLSLVSTSERTRAGRLRLLHQRRRWLTAHHAVRRILALELGADPAGLEFDTTAAGKPFLARPAASLEFNLSHSGRHCLIAVADRPVGVDIETWRAISDLSGVALRVTTAREAELLERRPAREIHSSFLGLWTRKEALLKALGQGFLIDPRQIEVGFGPAPSYVNVGARTWTVETLAVGPGMTAAVAIEGDGGTAPMVRSFE